MVSLRAFKIRILRMSAWSFSPSLSESAWPRTQCSSSLNASLAPRSCSTCRRRRAGTRQGEVAESAGFREAAGVGVRAGCEGVQRRRGGGGT
eukprot:6103428-Prymnesium_polylepis.1